VVFFVTYINIYEFHKIKRGECEDVLFKNCEIKSEKGNFIYSLRKCRRGRGMCEHCAKVKSGSRPFGILLGGFGVHSFYLGFVGKGIAQICLTIFCFGAGGIWGLIERNFDFDGFY
jgi:hypothetical protein